MRPNSAVLLFGAGALLLAQTAFGAPAANAARQFSLLCMSNAPAAPLQEFILDVNLDTNSYYGEIGGLDELGNVDDHEIIFRRHFRFEHTSGFHENYYSRDDGHLFWDRSAPPPPSTTPNATCKVVPPHHGFQANARYKEPGGNSH